MRLKLSRCIHESKRHHQILKETIPGLESRFEFVAQRHLHSVISLSYVKFSEYLSHDQLICELWNEG